MQRLIMSRMKSLLLKYIIMKIIVELIHFQLNNDDFCKNYAIDVHDYLLHCFCIR